MLKKIIVLAFCIVPLCSFAQKLGHLNSQEIFTAMPETATADKTIKDKATELQKTADGMRDEYNKAIKDFVDKRDSLSPAIQQAKQSEIASLETRITTFNQNAQNEIQKLQQDLMQPILDKIKKAIDEVGAENGYTYIFDMASTSIVYHSDKSDDVTPLVKAKLGIK